MEKAQEMIRWSVIIVAMSIGLQGAPAVAQGLCGDRDNIVRQLDKDYGQVRRGLGMINGVLLEVWASSKTGKFTILQSYVSGVGCVIMMGHGWQDEDWQAAELQKGPKT